MLSKANRFVPTRRPLSFLASSADAYRTVLKDHAAHCIGVDFTQLASSKVPEAQQLHYEVYHREQAWHPEPGNPSNVRFVGGRLRDDYEDSSIYIGGRDLDTQELIAVCRVMSNIDNPLEVSKYGATFQVPQDGVICETNRTAISKKWRKSGAVHYLFSYMVLTATVEWDATLVIGAVQANKTSNIAKRLHGFVLPGAAVRYEENDEERHFVAFNDSLDYRNAVLNTVTSLKLQHAKTSCTGSWANTAT